MSSRPLPLLLLVGCLLAANPVLPQESHAGPAENRWVYLENDHLKLGVDLQAGASIGWLSTASRPGKNVLNTYDPGRYVQQSYYGDPDGSDWNGQPWRYNPVQGGGWKGDPAKVLETRRDGPGNPGKTGITGLITRTQPRHWATGALLPEVEMKQHITLEGPVVRVRCTFHYRGATSHTAHHQELPAFFVEPEFDTLVFPGPGSSSGTPLERRHPGDKNEYITLGESWLAWVNADGLAVGVHSSGCTLATCYRVPGPAACSYAAPLQTFAITPGLVFEYTALLTVGTVQEVQARFLQTAGQTPPAPDKKKIGKPGENR